MTRYTNQLHIYPLLNIIYLFMNSSRPPFDNLRVRQAVNYAVDRNKLAEIFGGPLAVRPTCQILPPNFQGYRAYCPYTLNPISGGQWTAPDLSKAKELVQESGTAGMRITLVYPFFFPPAGGPYLISVLDSLGYRATLQAGVGASDDIDAYFNFIGSGGAPLAQAKPFAKQACWKCHNEHGAADNVFVQFYPVLREAKPAR